MGKSTLIAAFASALLLSSVSFAPAENIVSNNTQVYLNFTLEIPQGHFDEFKKAATGLIASTAKEPGAISYAFMVSDDEKTVTTWERFKDSEALLTHLNKTFPQHAKDILANSKPTRVVVSGNPNEEVKKALAGLNPVYFKPMDGFLGKK